MYRFNCDIRYRQYAKKVIWVFSMEFRLLTLMISLPALCTGLSLQIADVWENEPELMLVNTSHLLSQQTSGSHMPSFKAHLNMLLLYMIPTWDKGPS